MIKSFQDLKVYKKGMDLAEEIEKIVRRWPSYEKFQLTDQSRRASRAVPALIAEGWPKRRSIKSFRKYLKDAIGECNEMMSHLELAKRFGYLPQRKAKELIEHYDRLAGKIHKLKDNWRNY
jgi:four helix bundle protein